MLVGGWEDTQSVQKVCKPVHRDIPGWTPSGPASCWRTGQRSETRLLLGRPGLWSPSTAQTWGCMVVASATHPSGCSWTSQSWWLWRNDSTQRLWTSPNPGTANGKQRQPQLWPLSLNLVIVSAWLSLKSLLQEEKETFVSFEYHCLGHSHLTFLEKLIREKRCLLTINYRACDTLRKS